LSPDCMNDIIGSVSQQVGESGQHYVYFSRKKISFSINRVS